MSRHIVRDDIIQVVVGWDAPLLTFFADIYDTSLDEDSSEYVIAEFGLVFPPSPIRDIDYLEKIIKHWLPKGLPKGARDRLCREQRFEEDSNVSINWVFMPRGEFHG